MLALALFVFRPIPALFLMGFALGQLSSNLLIFLLIIPLALLKLHPLGFDFGLPVLMIAGLIGAINGPHDWYNTAYFIVFSLYVLAQIRRMMLLRSFVHIK